MPRPDYYSTRQVEAANLLNSIGIGGVNSEVFDEIINSIGDAEKKPMPVETTEAKESDEVIRLKMLEETDWRKRASLAAMLISHSLD